MSFVKEIKKFKNNNEIALKYVTDFRTFKITYKELYNKITKTIRLLDNLKIKNNDKILIWSQNRLEYMYIIFACILKGCQIVPIDLRSNVEFVKAVYKETNAKLIFKIKYKPNTNLKEFFIEDLDISIDNLKPLEKFINLKDNDLVEIVYTSGTTAKPKGVMLTNKNILENIKAIKQIVNVDNEFRFLSLLPLSHMFEQTVGLFVPLFSNASITYLQKYKTSLILETIKKEKITVILVVPRILELFRNKIETKIKFLNIIKYLPFKKVLLFPIHNKFPYLKYFAVGGAKLDEELERFWNNLGFTLLQGYGLTETSPVISFNSPKDKKFGSIGKILSNLDVKIEDGEILVKGPSVFKGYYKNEEKTKKVFKNEYFKTGDLGYIDKDNFLFFKGRKKDLIVISEGLNIYPEDIEFVLKSINNIKDCCVLEINNKIHAVLLLKDKTKAKQIIDKANLKLDSSQQIQDFSIWPYEDFPRTTTLKIEKYLLKEFIEKKSLEKVLLKVKEKESKLYSLMKYISKIENIKPNYRLGTELKLGSIDRLELASLIEQEFNIEIDENLLTHNTRVRELDEIIKKEAKLSRIKFRRWTLSKALIVLRYILQKLILYTFVNLFCWTKVYGLENLNNLRGPVIFVSNHQSYFDALVIIKYLPFRYKISLAPATLAEYFESKNIFGRFLKLLIYNFATIFYNTFLFPQKTRFIHSMRYSGELIDKGFSVLYFPEGERTLDGKILPFKIGIGMLALNLTVPIVPIKIEGLFEIWPRNKFIQKLGRATIKFGKPMLFKTGSYIDITNKIEKSVKEL